MPYMPDLIANALSIDVFWVFFASFALIKFAGIAAAAWLIWDLFLRDRIAPRNTRTSQQKD